MSQRNFTPKEIELLKIIGFTVKKRTDGVKGYIIYYHFERNGFQHAIEMECDPTQYQFSNFPMKDFIGKLVECMFKDGRLDKQREIQKVIGL